MVVSRRSKFRVQISDALMILSSCLKAGLSLLQAIESVVEELPSPINQEFGLILRENKMDITDEDKEAAREMMREYAKDKPMLVELIDPEEDRIEIGVAYLPGMLKKMRS